MQKAGQSDVPRPLVLSEAKTFGGHSGFRELAHGWVVLGGVKDLEMEMWLEGRESTELQM